MNNNNRSELERLWRATPFCHWCGTKTQLMQVNGGKQPANSATRDHVISRNNPKSRGHRGQPVLSCLACNRQRAKDEHNIERAVRLNAREDAQRAIAHAIAAIYAERAK